MKTWRNPIVDRKRALELASELNVPVPAAAVLIARGLDTAEALTQFLNPRLSDLSDPFALPDMQKAVDRIWLAIEKGENIAVYGDYDVDGVTSTALLLDVLRKLGAKVTAFLPRRLEEGYGVSTGALTRCIESCKPSLIITVDCGTNIEDESVLSVLSGIDLVVTDHHEKSGSLPAAVAVVNPKTAARSAASELAGVGVAFKLCHALLKHDRKTGKQARNDLDLRCYLDLVAIGTVADVVPLTGENRILVHHGLLRVNKTTSTGIKALADVSGIKNDIGTYEIGFMLGPRLNAAGRLASAEDALNLLLSGDESAAGKMAAGLDAANRERKRVEEEIVKDALEELGRVFNPAADFGIAVGQDGWHAGAIGIAASRICGRYNRPTAVTAFDADGKGKGSCRSIEDFDIVAALKECADLLDGFGGHQMAAGFTIKRDNFDLFRSRFNEACAAKLREKDLRPVQRIDMWIALNEANDQLLAATGKMQPFGVGNHAPVWAVNHVRILGQPKKMGKESQHIRLTLAEGATQLEAVGWNMGDREIPEGHVDVAFHLESNDYMGRSSLRLNMKDIRPSESQGGLLAEGDR